ncbi:hypothetical protein BJX68DRAFT_248844 [Aspergillus pseudodeflectus]|uniref:F-box domain-containing protein n=1 Tax=Aspergillus pseudodeflectus TaxID=176178 RepID=A0ABR4JEL7_9EURO
MEPNAPGRLHLYSLPNEVFVQILSPFTTRELLPLATVSQRFHALVLRLLHYRLLLSANLAEYKLILECFHPTSKLIEPHVFCTYLGTPGLSDKYEGDGSLYENLDTAEKLGRLGSLYSRFKPESPGEESPALRRPVNLEGFEEFSQLCVVVNVVKALPGTTHLLSAVNVEDGVIRLFRGWLKSQANDPQSFPDQHTLWVTQSKNVGLKFRVREVTRLDTSLPVLIHRDEESFLTYEIIIDELLVRTTRLLLTVEKSLQEQQHYPNAVVFGRAFG